MSFTGTGTSTFINGLTVGSLNLGGGARNIFVNNKQATSTLILTAGGGVPTITLPARGAFQTESTTNRINKFVLDFHAGSDECAFWDITMPESWDGRGVDATFTWTATTTGQIVWGIRALSLGHNDAIDSALSATSTVVTSVTSANDVMISSSTSAFTPGGTGLSGGDNVYFQVCRDTANASDTMTGFARLLQIKIEYAKKSYSD